jgi:hypothetical protein
MALWAKNKANFSVAFTEDAADQTLLAAIEKELAFTKYQTFSNLCKQALWQFLSVSESASSTQNFQRLEQRIAELVVKFAEFEHNVSAEELSRLEGLEHHLSQLSAQLDQLQGTVNSKFAEVVPPRDSDPLLERLSSLLPQDF